MNINTIRTSVITFRKYYIYHKIQQSLNYFTEGVFYNINVIVVPEIIVIIKCWNALEGFHTKSKYTILSEKKK